MISYYMTSESFEGEIEFHFDHNDFLTSIVFNADLKDFHYNFIFTLLPYNVERMEKMIEAIKKSKNNSY